METVIFLSRKEAGASRASREAAACGGGAGWAGPGDDQGRWGRCTREGRRRSGVGDSQVGIGREKSADTGECQNGLSSTGC
jgi:hypothetical protein